MPPQTGTLPPHLPQTACTPFFRSYPCNDPELVDLVSKQRPPDFPKSERLRAGLKPLLGESIFISNGETWAHH